MSLLPDDGRRYSIGVNFQNISDERSALPRCWAVPGPGRAAPLVWANAPLLDPDERATAQGIVRFKAPIREVDEVVCDPDVAASYRD